MEKRINEELRQFKLFKIQETESKLRRFNQKYSEIKEHIVLKVSKNITSNLVRFVFRLLTLLFFLFAITLFFPEEIIEYIDPKNKKLSADEKMLFNLLKYFSFCVASFFLFVGYLLKLSVKKRSSIYSLSLLLEEVISYMETSSTEDKRKYEYFIDSLAEQERIKKNTK
jgi:hypothetical protein